MPDREKVIRGLEHCSEDGCKDCPYETDCTTYIGFTDLAKDVLELLKEQEPVKPFTENYWKNTMGRCGHCKAPLPALEGLRSKFCWMCGRRVKWE